MTATLVDAPAVAQVNLGSPDDAPEDLTHIVRMPESETGMSPQNYVLQARVLGTPIQALCGYEWVPSKDPLALPVCPKCWAIYQYDPKGHGDRDEAPDA